MSSRRLPRNESIIPEHYDVHLTTDLDSGQFCGSVKIDFHLDDDEQISIKLDTSHLTIDLSSITLSSLTSLTNLPCASEHFERRETLEISLKDEQTFSRQHPYRLTINSFSGHLTIESQTGFYRSTVQINSTTKKHYGLTQMSPTHCRRVFPCFDEPSLRSTFDLTLDIPREMQALSNMPQLSSKDNFLNSGTKRIRFQRTPSMPTFLLCFVIGEFDIVRTEPVQRWSKDHAEPIELTAYTLPGRKDETKFALDCARRALHYYADLFEIEYPMSKLDLVAVPDLFYPAMENWALILFKEEEMLINDENAVSFQYRNVCQSVTHEIAHQWMGNLVSIHWWSDVYVVEGFAKWFEYLATDYIVPEYNVFSEFFSTQFLRYFDYCLHILHNEATELDEKDFAFEGFIYSKGSCLMRMLHLFIGHEPFLQSIRLFLRRYSYQTATANDFWTCLEEITHLPISNSSSSSSWRRKRSMCRSILVQLVHSWCTKKSYPVVQVQMIDYDETTGTYDLSLKQMSFCDGEKHPSDENLICCHCVQRNDASDESKSTWLIPLTIFTSRSSDHLSKHLMSKSEERIQISPFDLDPAESNATEPTRKRTRSSSSSWLKFNSCSSGPYRIFYSSTLIEQLLEGIRRNELNTFDRFNLENDMYALAMGGFTSLVDYLRLLLQGYIEERDDELVWKDIESNLIRIATLLEYEDELCRFYRQFILHFHRSLFQRLGFTADPQESVAKGRLRCFLLVILGTIGNDPAVISYGREQLQIYLTDSNVTILWPICAIVAHHASDGDLHHLFQLWEQRSRRDDRLRCAYGLSYVQRSTHIDRVLDLFANYSSSSSTANSSHSLRLHERIECYKGFCLSREGRVAYQRYIEKNWLALRANYTDEYLEALIRETFGYFASADEAKQIEEFFLFYENFHGKSTSNETPSTPCTRIAVHLSLDDQELSTLTRSSLLSPLVAHQRPIIPNKVKEVASILIHTTRTRAALLERDRENLRRFFQSHPSISIAVNSHPLSNFVPSTLTHHKRKRRLSSSASPPVRNLLASDATA